MSFVKCDHMLNNDVLIPSL